MAVALKQAKSDEFKTYQKQVLINAKQMEIEFKRRGYNIVSGGTDTHLLLLDLRNKKVDGARVERILEMINIATNKNTIPSDKSALVPSGIRIGSPAMTTRGLKEADFVKIVDFMDEAIVLAADISGKVPGKKFKDFSDWLVNDTDALNSLELIKKRVVEFSLRFPAIGQ